jgi:hypothetical protein
MFLRCGAAGVLATTGAVGKQEAGKVAGELIRLLAANRRLWVADAVRQLRADAAGQMSPLMRAASSARERNTNNRQLRPLLYPSMYVYFGSPRMEMSLAGKGGRGDVHGPPGGGGAS